MNIYGKDFSRLTHQHKQNKEPMTSMPKKLNYSETCAQTNCKFFRKCLRPVTVKIFLILMHFIPKILYKGIYSMYTKAILLSNSE